jgi:hypothetical protein
VLALSGGHLAPVVKNPVRIDHGNGLVAIAAEHDQRDGFGRLVRSGGCSLFHRREGGGEVMGGA